ncbi:hypothetical protein OS493_038864 [Desmophyllum pertusum]|uniref:Uncharacterized protein n=1 Tax=Desmophyllum pertusum TaxID=174260 RepID=A0A9W9Y736_9CNID|nr:hypothetical protein OS493_038864 [Desmophyllum pertusum]
MVIQTRYVSTENTEEKKEEMEQGIDDCVYELEAAQRLGMHHFAHVLRLNLALLRQVYKTTFQQHPTVPHELIPRIVAQSMHDLCEDNFASLEKISKLAREGEDNPSPEINKEELPHRPMTAFRVYMSDPEPNQEDEEESSAESSSTGLRTPSPKASRRRPSHTKKKRRVESEEESSAESASTGPRTPSSVATTSKRLHHRKKNCPVEKCSFFGNNLKRHLNIHVRKGDISEEVDAMVAIVTTGKCQRGRPEKRKVKNASQKPTKKGRFKKWCPMAGCSKVVLNVGHHLSEGNCHRLKKGSVEYKLMLKDARPYTGDDDEEELAPKEMVQEEMSDAGEVEEAQDEAKIEDEDEEDENEEEEEDEEEEEEEDSDSDSDSECDPDKMNNLEFFTFNGTKTNRQRWLVGFYT